MNPRVVRKVFARYFTAKHIKRIHVVDHMDRVPKFCNRVHKSVHIQRVATEMFGRIKRCDHAEGKRLRVQGQVILFHLPYVFCLFYSA